MKMYRRTPLAAELNGFDYRESVTSLDLPVYFISGESDFNCPWPLVEEYCEKIEAPDKGFYLIKNAAHSPLWENPAETCDILKQIRGKILHE